MTCIDYLDMESSELLEVLANTFIYDIPKEILTPEDLKEVSKMLSETSNQYSFLIQLSSMAKIQKRKAVRNKNKILKEDLIDKEYIIEKITDSVKLRYSTLSRLITAKQEYNKELNMNKQL